MSRCNHSNLFTLFKIPSILFIVIATLLIYGQGAAKTLNTQQPQYLIDKTPSWVTPVTIPMSSLTTADPFKQLLSDVQYKVDKSGVVRYSHGADLIANKAALEHLSRMEIPFDPQYQSLILHSLSIIRAGQSLNKLDRRNIKLLQREQDLDRNLYDGTITAMIILDDVRVGDIIEYSYSIKGYNPVFGNKFSANASLGGHLPIELRFVRFHTDQNRKFYTKTHGTNLNPTITEKNGYRDIVWEVRNTSRHPQEDGTPSWYVPFPWIQLSEYASWQEVAKWADDLYPPQGNLSADLIKQIDAWKSSSKSVEEAVEKAITFVQEDVRYFGIELGQNSHKPSHPNQVFNNRYGDCKDKSLLLATVLNKLGAKAYTALVSSAFGNELDKLLPSPSAFDHVVTVFELNGNEYWIDATRGYQGYALNEKASVNFKKSLIVGKRSTALASIPEPKHNYVDVTVNEHIKITEYQKPVKMVVTTVFKGNAAEQRRYAFSKYTLEEISKFYMASYNKLWPGINAVEPMKITDDKKENIFTVIETYTIDDFFKSDKEKWVIEVYGLTIRDSIKVPDVQKRTAPFAINHPARVQHRTSVEFPDNLPIKLEDKETKIENDHMLFTANARYADRIFTMDYDYSTRRDIVMPDAVSNFVETARKIKLGLYYSIEGSKPGAKRSSW